MENKRKPLTFEEKKAKVAEFNVMDALGKDEYNREVIIEVQKKNDDNHVKRTRYLEALTTSFYTEAGDGYIKVPNVIVVFISRFDLFNLGKAIYHVRPAVQETGDIVNDGTAYIYVNSKINDGSLIAELMQYMERTEGENPHFPKLSNRVKVFKESKEGIEAMCEIMERERMEGTIDRNIDLIQKKLDKHKSMRQIADEMEETMESMQNLINTYKDRLNFPESWKDYNSKHNIK